MFETKVTDLQQKKDKNGGSNINICQSKEEGKYQESIQSSTTPDPGHNMGK